MLAQLHSSLENLPAGFTTSWEFSEAGDTLHNSSGDFMKLKVNMKVAPDLIAPSASLAHNASDG